NAGANPIRFTSVFVSNNVVRTPFDQTFATQPDIPAAGISLYRFSAGHGGLQCSACHGSTHAIFPSIHANDNLRNQAIQGHAGTTVECTACHTAMPTAFAGGPHGLHPVGKTAFAEKRDNQENLFHGHAKEDGNVGLASCRACHGLDDRGTVLSRAHADRVLNAGGFGTKRFWRGQTVGCYDCHNGPTSEAPSANTPPVVASLTTNTTSGAPISFPLPASDPNANPLTLRIVSQPHHGSVGLSNAVATYFPEPGFIGTDQFTFAARDGTSDSNLGTGTVSVAQGPFAITATTLVPDDYPAGWPVPFTVASTPSNVWGAVAHQWNYGDGSAPGTHAHEAHVYSAPGSYAWLIVSAVSDGLTTVSVTNSGNIVIGNPMEATVRKPAGGVEISWPALSAQAVLEEAAWLNPTPTWVASTNPVVVAADRWSATVAPTGQTRFFRLRHVQ
ncbi:MAG: Ig-like domain-containing protein, partial [Verrucomicrobia bacterium]|nr:Ig-like domain-containing protein [Verrucomicrobiota bacterium]